MKVLFLQPPAHVAALGVNLSRLREVARFGAVNLVSLPKKLAGIGAVVNTIDTSAAARWVLESAMRRGIPRVYLFDGIFDLANAYHNPAHRRRRLYQMDPLLYSHVACVDRWTHTRWTALGVQTHAWLPARARLSDVCKDGNRGGHDGVEQAAPAGAERAAPQTAMRSFLVATARNPAFDGAERSRLKRLLALTITALDRLGVSYRFRTGDAKLLASLGIAADLNDASDSFARCIRRYQCLITTPSTVATTAMLAGKPTATLDYRDSPLTQQTGWRIHRSADIGSVLVSMLQAAPERMTFQAREVAHLVDRQPVEEFILRAARVGPPQDGVASRPPRLGLDYPMRWVYVNWIKRFRKGL
ncbi:hypothetical protein [Candidatus Foliamicus sp.]